MSEELATLVAPNDAKYVIVCHECKKSDWTYQDCKITRSVRRGVAQCGDCGGELTMLRDSQEGDL
jgi:predicted SprT family Zn-dependent metalloprotease